MVELLPFGQSETNTLKKYISEKYTFEEEKVWQVYSKMVKLLFSKGEVKVSIRVEFDATLIHIIMF